MGSNCRISGFCTKVETNWCKQNIHLVHFALEKKVLGEFGDGARLG